MPPPLGSDEKVTPISASNDAEDENDIAAAIGDEETSYPEGGLRAWLVVLGSFCGMYVTLKPSTAMQMLTLANASLLRLHEQHQYL